VVPFDNLSPHGTEGWVGEAFAEALSTHLLAAGQGVVTHSERRRVLGGKGLEPGAPPTLGAVLEAGEELGATQAVLGSFRVEGEAVEVTAQVFDLGTGKKLGVIEDHGELEKLLELQNQLAKNLLRLDGTPVPESLASIAERRRVIPLEAYKEFILAQLTDAASERRELLESVLQMYPAYSEAALALGQLLLESGETSQAIEALSSIPPEDPVYRAAYFTMGLAYLAATQNRLAAEIFGRLSEQEESASFLNNLGVALLRAGENERALEAFREAVDREPSDITYRFNLGWGAWRAGAPSDARGALLEVVLSDPEDAEAHLLLSVVATAEERLELAETERDVALSLSPDLAEVNPSSLEGLERVVDQLPPAVPRQGAEAVAERSPPPADRGGLEEARSLRASGELEEAARELERAVYRDPHAVEIRLELAAVYQEMGELDKAAAELLVALWNREEVPTHIRLAEIYETMGDTEKALAHAERAVELNGNDLAARGTVERLRAGQP
jgi:Tfp pilus assembly protein PilF/TolB-like protein